MNILVGTGGGGYLIRIRFGDSIFRCRSYRTMMSRIVSAAEKLSQLRIVGIRFQKPLKQRTSLSFLIEAALNVRKVQTGSALRRIGVDKPLQEPNRFRNMTASGIENSEVRKRSWFPGIRLQRCCVRNASLREIAGDLLQISQTHSDIDIRRIRSQLGQQSQRSLASLTISALRELRVRKPKLAIARSEVAHRNQPNVLIAARTRMARWTSLDVVISHLLMRDVSRVARDHVALRAVRLLGMMCSHCRRSVTSKASLAEVLNTLLRTRLEVRIVTRCASHLVTSRALARAAQQSFVLACAANAAARIARADEVHSDVIELVSRHELRQRTSLTIDHSIAFEMTLNASAVALHDRQLARIGDWTLTLQRQMLLRIAMTRAASNASLTERLSREVVARVLQRRLNLRSVTVQAVRIGRQRRRHARGIVERRSHVERLPTRVVVDRYLVPTTFLVVQIRSSAMPRTDVVLKPTLAVERSIGARCGTRIRHPCSSVACEDLVVHAGERVVKLARQKTIRRDAASSRHRGLLVLVVDGAMAGSADSVRIVELGFGQL